MGFGDIVKRVGIGVGTGGLSEVARALGTSDSTVTQGPMRTPEQVAAQQALLKYGQTGNIGGFTTGQQYTGSMGDFNMTDLEKMSQSQLTQLLTSGQNKTFGMGQTVLSDLLTTDKYDPTKTGGVYDMLKGSLDRNITDATTAAKRTAGYTGNLYSKDAIRSYGDVAAKGAESKNTLLAGICQDYINKKLGAIPTAFSAGAQDQSMALDRIQAGYSGGSLERNLNTAEDQSRYQEWLRARGETGQQVQALSSVANANTQFGSPSVTVPGQNGWEALLNIGAKVAPAALKAMA